MNLEWSGLSLLLSRPIAFHRVFATVGGGACAGLFLSQAFYWTSRTKDPDGWFYKTQEEWEEETALTRQEQEGVRKNLKTKGLIEEKKEGIPCKLYYKINKDALLAALQGNFKVLSLDEILNLYKVELARLSKVGLARAAKHNIEREFVNYADVLRNYGATCHFCNQPITRGIGQSKTALCFDHIIPISAGGSHTFDNIKPSHAQCNLIKGGSLDEKAETLDNNQSAYSKQTSPLTVNKQVRSHKANWFAYSKQTTIDPEITSEITTETLSPTSLAELPKEEREKLEKFVRENWREKIDSLEAFLSRPAYFVEWYAKFKASPVGIATECEEADWTTHPDWADWVAHMRKGFALFVSFGTCFDREKRKAIAHWAAERNLIWGEES